jgi:hypothetical protein
MKSSLGFKKGKSAKRMMSALVALFMCLAAVFTASAQARTTPESLTLLFEEESYTVAVKEVGTDENGNTTVTLSGLGDSLILRKGEFIMHIQASILCGGKEYGWENAGFDNGLATFYYNTDQKPETVLVYSYDNPDLRKEFMLDLAGGDTGTPAMPMETPLEFELGSIVITAANDSPVGQPANMAEGERAMMLEMTVDLPLTQTKSEFDLLYENAYLKDAEGNEYRAGCALQAEPKDNQVWYALLYAFPKDLLTQDLLFCFEGQTRSLTPSKEP